MAYDEGLARRRVGMKGGGNRGTKKPGTPNVIAEAALARLNRGRNGSSTDGGMIDAWTETHSQNARGRATRCSGGFPAIKQRWSDRQAIPEKQPLSALHSNHPDVLVQRIAFLNVYFPAGLTRSTAMATACVKVAST